MERMEVVDYVLVPTGLLMMAAYHIWLLHRIAHRPTTTIIGINAINRRFWVSSMMQDVGKNGVLAVQTLRNNIMASTLLASTAIMLSSLIAVLMTSGSSGGHRSMPVAAEGLIFLGDKSQLGLSLKFFFILVCFLAAFLLNVQSIRYYSHASVLINVPSHSLKLLHHKDHHVCDPHCPENGDDINDDDDGDDDDDDDNDVMMGYQGYVARIVNRGSYFWSLGLRAFYFSFPLFLWIFGPIPMFLCCLLLVFMLYFLDMAFHSNWVVSGHCSESRKTHCKPKKLDLEMG